MELQLKLPGAGGTIDAGRATEALADVLWLLRQLEAAQSPERSSAAPTRWVFRALSVSSLNAAFEPVYDTEPVQMAALTLVRGLALVEEQPVLPEGWNEPVALRARRVVRRNATPAGPVQLRVIIGGETAATADLGQEAAANLKVAVRPTSQSIGSATGVLGSVSVHRRPAAGLWPDRGGRLTVVFDTDQLDQVKAGLGKRVTVSGRFDRNSAGQAVRLRMARIIPLPAPAPLTGLWGLDRGMTDGQTPEEHLRRIRG